MSASSPAAPADFGHFVFVFIVAAFAAYATAEASCPSAYVAILGTDLHLLLIIVRMAQFIDYRISRDPRGETIWRWFPSIRASLLLVSAYLACFTLGFRTLRASGQAPQSLGENLSAFLTFQAGSAPPANYPLLLQILSAVLWILLAVPILGSRLADRSKF